jgi:trigger factor
MGVQLPPLAPIFFDLDTGEKRRTRTGFIKGDIVKVSIKDGKNCTKEIETEVPAEDIQAKVDTIYQRLSREAKIDGFRKGKAPLEVVQKKFKSSVRDEIIQRELPEYVRSVIEEKQLKAVSSPQITHLQFEEGSPLKFVVVVETKPVFELKNYKGLKVKKEKTSVKEDDVDKALENLREQFAQFVPVEERPARENDLVVIDFDGKINGQPFEGGKAARFPVLLGSQSLLKDFEDNLIGLKKSENKVFKITFPQDYAKKDVAGKEVEFTVTIQEIKEKKLPIVDNEFAKNSAKCDDVKTLREKLETQIKAGKEVEQRSKMVEQIGEKLISDHPFEVPVSLVNIEQQRLAQQGVQRLRNQGVDFNKLSEEQKKEFIEKLRPVAQKNVHMAMIIEKITEAERIRCEDEDLEAYYGKISESVNQTVDAVKRYIQQKGNLDGVKEWIQYEKALDFLISVAKVEAA